MYICSFYFVLLKKKKKETRDYFANTFKKVKDTFLFLSHTTLTPSYRHRPVSRIESIILNFKLIER